MATYEYACIECDESIEVNRGMTEKELVTPCPKCGYSMSRIWNAPGIQFKGSGFYKTDNG
jgi:putative FmdB family regulatory protein